jgi:hypothetical protein
MIIDTDDFGQFLFHLLLPWSTVADCDRMGAFYQLFGHPRSKGNGG